MRKKFFVFPSTGIVLLLVLLWASYASHGQAKTITVCANGCAFSKIQAALDAAAAGDSIWVSTGVYKEYLHIKKSVTLAADGSVIVQPASENSIPQALVTIESAKGVFLKGLTLSGSSVAGLLMRGGSATVESSSFTDNAAGVLVTGGATLTLTQSKISDGITVRDKSTLTASQNVIRDGADHGIVFLGATGTLRENEISRYEKSGLVLTISSSVSLTKNTIASNKASGVEIDETSEAKLEGNTLSQNGFAGIVVSTATPGRVKISSNQLSANEWGIRVHGSAEILDNRIQGSRWCALWADTNAQVTGSVNKLSDNGAELCGPMPLSLRQPVAAQTSRTQINVPADFKTLQEALDAVAPGGTVTLAAGTLVGPVGIYKSVTIQGSAGTVLDGAKKIAIVIAAEARKISLRNITVRAGLVGLLVEASASEITVSLEQSTIASNERDGVEIRSPALVSVQQSAVNGNGAACPELSECAGLTVGREGALSAARAQILNSTVSENNGHGIVLNDPTLSLIENATIERNQRDGLVVLNGAQAQVKASVFMQNSNGVRALGKAKITLNSVKLIGQRFEGIRLDGREVQAEILSTEIQQSRNNGLLAQNGAQLSARESKLFANAQFGISLQDSGRVTLEKITATGNLAGGILISSPETVTVVQSQINANKGTGVQVMGATKAELRDNEISNNEGKKSDGVSLSDTVQAILQGNRVIANGRDGVLVAGRVTADLRNNQISKNLLWGIATWTKKCHPGDAQIPDQFDGRVSGAGNTIDSNLGGDLCGVSGLR